MSYFNQDKRKDELTEYDRLFYGAGEFDPKKQREDRQNIGQIRNRIFKEVGTQFKIH